MNGIVLKAFREKPTRLYAKIVPRAKRDNLQQTCGKSVLKVRPFVADSPQRSHSESRLRNTTTKTLFEIDKIIFNSLEIKRQTIAVE